MNTTKVGTQKVGTQRVNVSGSSKKFGFLNIYYLTSYIFAFTMFIIFLGCLFVKTDKYLGFYYKENEKMAGWAIFLIILAIVSFALVFGAILLRRIHPNDTKCSHLVRDCLFTNLVLLYLLILGCCTKNDSWLWNLTNIDKISTGGVNVVIWCIVFVCFLGYSQVNHFWGEQIKVWFAKHNPLKK